MLKKQQVISGVLALVICCTTIFSGITASAAEIETEKPEIAIAPIMDMQEQIIEGEVLYNEDASMLPHLLEIEERLNEDEIVTAEDITIFTHQEFDISKDYRDLTFSDDKVKVEFKNAVNEKLETFTMNREDTYQAVYEVVPIRDEGLAYQVSRYIIVKNKEVETTLEFHSQVDNESEQNTESDDSDGESERQEIESNNEIVALEDMDENLFVSVVPTLMSARQSQTVTLVQGARLQYPSHIGNYSTNYFYVNGKIAYCLESPKSSPANADYVADVLNTNINLQKVLYYGYGGPGDLTRTALPNLNDDTRYIYTHLAASYAYIGEAGFYGCSRSALETYGVIAYINLLFGQENPPLAELSLNSEYETAYLEGDVQKTKTFQLNGDHRNYISLNVPANVTYHNATSGNTQTGGTIRIYGGGRFYFTAPKTVTGEWRTGVLKGQLGAQWKTLVLKTGGSSQDIGYGDFIVDTEGSVNFAVRWLDIAKISLKKVDHNTNVNLSGAIFGVYSDRACTNLIVRMPATNANGGSIVEIPKTQDVVYVKEITAPVGYRLNLTAYNITLVAGGNTDVTITNLEQKGRMRIHKTGEKLEGVKEGDPMVFSYNNANFEGATYSIFAAEDIISQDKKTVIHRKDALIETLTTQADGNAISKDLYLGRYRIVETKAPQDLTIGREITETTKTVTLEYAGQDVALSERTVDYNNKRPEISVRTVKKSKNDNMTLEGARYGLYAGANIQVDGKVILEKDTLIETASSNVDGITTFTADIPINYPYYIREVQAPEKYYKSDEMFEFLYSYKDDKTYEYIFSYEFKNEEVRAEIHISKIDKETRKFLAQGDATLVGAEYGLFAAEDIQHPNKKDGAVYKKGDLVARGMIDTRGNLDFTNLYLGKYYVKELQPSEGYLLDPTEYPVDAAYEGQDVKIVHRDVTVIETIKKQPFQLIKVGAADKQTEGDLLENAGFKVYLISSLQGVKDGAIKPDANGNYAPEIFRDYDFSREQTALDYSEDSNGVPMPEFFTDSKGYAVSRELAYGKYVVIESTVPDNYAPIDPFIVYITEDKREPQQWRVFIDHEFEALLKIYKMDANSKLPVLHVGATFKIYDLNKEEYVIQYTHYPTLIGHTEFTTSESGYLITPERLKTGRYRIEEVKAPDGYTKSDPIEITIDSNVAYEVVGETGAVIITSKYENKPQTGTLRLQKSGEKLVGYAGEEKSLLQRFGEFLTFAEREDDSNFIYEERVIEGAEFAIHAAENIYSPDHQRDDSGNRIILYKKDELVANIKTDKDGKADLENLPLGKYKITEIMASNGFVLNKEVQEFTLEHAADEIEIVYHDSKYLNERQKVSIRITKLDAETKEAVAGATFGLYAAEDISSVDGDVIIPKDTLIEVAVSDENGLVSFKKDMPLANFYAKEMEAAPGYILSDEIVEFELQYAGQDTEVLEVTAEVDNDFTKIEISKVDIGGEEIVGAEMILRDSDGNEIDSWISNGTPHRINRLAPGDYVLIEKLAPEGYELAEDIRFTVLETGEIQKVIMVDEYEKKGTISVEKVGDMLSGITTYDSDFGKINRLEYEKLPLPGVEFTIYDADGEEVDVITTTIEGVATSKELPLGDYMLKETKTPAGLAMNDTEYEVTIEKDKDNKVIDISLDIENEAVDTEINVFKVGEMLAPDGETYAYQTKPLEGVYFGIYTNEELENYKGETLLSKDNLVGVIKTNKEGKATLKDALVFGHYYYKELQTLEGYILDDTIRAFELTLGNEPLTVLDVNKENPALNKLVKARVSLIKVDANNEEKRLSGAEFELFTKDGDSIGVYETDSNGEINITDLGYGEYYFRELKAPEGYQKLDMKIEFSVKGQNITITCRNNKIPDTPKPGIPKLGFEDGTLMKAIIFVSAGVVVLGGGLFIYKKKFFKKS